ncbi:MAG: sodium:calcium antiporter, partial [Blautia sp.]|nr:sodium:calcium antiporter [Blautia sp.]
TLAPFDIPSNKIIAGMNASLVVDVPLMLFVMAFLTLPALKREKLSRVQGIVLLVIYAVFCVFQFAL